MKNKGTRGEWTSMIVVILDVIAGIFWAFVCGEEVRKRTMIQQHGMCLVLYLGDWHIWLRGGL